MNGALKQVKRKDGTVVFDMTDEDYLQDFDLFQQAFAKADGRVEENVYADLAAPMANRPKEQPAFEANVPYPATRAAQTAGGDKLPGALDINKKTVYEEKALATQLTPDEPAMHNAKVTPKTEAEAEMGQNSVPPESRSDTNIPEAVAPPTNVGAKPAEAVSGGAQPRDEQGRFAKPEPMDTSDDPMPPLEPEEVPELSPEETAELAAELERQRKIREEAEEAILQRQRNEKRRERDDDPASPREDKAKAAASTPAAPELTDEQAAALEARAQAKIAAERAEETKRRGVKREKEDAEVSAKVHEYERLAQEAHQQALDLYAQYKDKRMPMDQVDKAKEFSDRGKEYDRLAQETHDKKTRSESALDVEIRDYEDRAAAAHEQARALYAQYKDKRMPMDQVDRAKELSDRGKEFDRLASEAHKRRSRK